MRASARSYDSRKESGNRKRKGENGKGVNEERAERWSALKNWYAVGKENTPNLRNVANLFLRYLVQKLFFCYENLTWF